MDPFGSDVNPKDRPQGQKNKSEKSGMFLAVRKPAFSDHNPLRIHHDLTIKTPQRTRAFSITPLKKTPVKPEKRFNGRP
jgi:hypothetical protein